MDVRHPGKREQPTVALRKYSFNKGFAGCSRESIIKEKGDAPSRWFSSLEISRML